MRVNAVAPGMVDTRIHADAGDPHRVARVAARVPMGRVGQPEEIAPAIAWLLGPEAGYVTGAVLRVAGGLWSSRRETHVMGWSPSGRTLCLRRSRFGCADHCTRPSWQASEPRERRRWGLPR